MLSAAVGAASPQDDDKSLVKRSEVDFFPVFSTNTLASRVFVA
jgi:hypothetical protein